MEKNMSVQETVESLAIEAKKAARKLGFESTTRKNNVLLRMAEMLLEQKDFIQSENEKDLMAGREKDLSAAMLDRLALSDNVIDSMVKGLQEVVALPDPVGEVDEMIRRPNGLMVGRMRIPLGVIGMIYESRPNVTVDAAALCLKAGNAVILRGGSEAIHSNLALAKVLQSALASENISPAAIQVIPIADREAVNVLLSLEDHVDLIIPRGGEGLIRFVAQNSRIPVLKHYKGVCHALETLLVHREIAAAFLPQIGARLINAGVEIRGCPLTKDILADVKDA